MAPEETEAWEHLTEEELDELMKAEMEEAARSVTVECEKIEKIDRELRTANAKRWAERHGKEFDGKLPPSTLPWVND